MWASTAITFADPSGLWGLLRKAMAGSLALLEAKQNPNTNPLVKAVAEAFTCGVACTPTRDHMQAILQGAQVAQLEGRAVEELRSVAAILISTTPGDAAAFKKWLKISLRRRPRPDIESVSGLWRHCSGSH